MVQERKRTRSHVSEQIQRESARDNVPARIDEDRIRQRAYDRYCERGCEDGHDLDDWLEAERLLRN